MNKPIEQMQLGQPLIAEIVILMESLTAEERLKVMYEFCAECGVRQPNENEEYAMRCQCWNDE